MSDRPQTQTRTRPGPVLRPGDGRAALDLLDSLTERGAPVASLTVTPGELLVNACADVTPPEGMALLRELKDDPDGDVTVHRTPGVAELAVRYAGRRLRYRITRGQP